MLSLTSQLSADERLQLLKSLHSMRTQKPQDFTAMCEWLEQLLNYYDKRNRTADGADMHRGQGKAVLLADLIETLSQSTELLRKSVS